MTTQVFDPEFVNPVLQSEELNVDYLAEYPLQFTGLYKTRINVQVNRSSVCFYYNFVNIVTDLLSNFGTYTVRNYEFFCRSENT